MKFSFRVYLMSVRVISWRNTISKLRLCLGWNWNECRLTSCNIKNSSFPKVWHFEWLQPGKNSTLGKIKSIDVIISYSGCKFSKISKFWIFFSRSRGGYSWWLKTSSVLNRLWEWFYLFMTEIFVKYIPDTRQIQARKLVTATALKLKAFYFIFT